MGCADWQSGVYAACSAVNCARSPSLFTDWAEIEHFPGDTAIARGLVLVPALSGLAVPHRDRSARGTWLGLSLDTTRLDMVQAVLEGVALRVGEVLDEMKGDVAIRPPISIDGGMSRNPWFCQFVADVIGRQIRVSTEVELTALGCAQLAAHDFPHRLRGSTDLRSDEPANLTRLGARTLVTWP